MKIEPRTLEVIDEVDGYSASREDAWQIPREEAELLYQIALSANAQVVVEVGTSYGFSGLFWGAAMKRTGGHLHTIDIDPKKYDQSKLNFARAGLDDVITSHLGDAHEILPVLAGGFDIVFLDADKASSREYLELVWPKLSPGGSVLTDNALTHREALGDLVKQLRSRGDANSIEVGVGKGLEWAIKLR